MARRSGRCVPSCGVVPPAGPVHPSGDCDRWQQVQKGSLPGIIHIVSAANRRNALTDSNSGAQMYISFASGAPTNATKAAVAHSEPLDALVALEQIGTRRCFERGKEIYADGDA